MRQCFKILGLGRFGVQGFTVRFRGNTIENHILTAAVPSVPPLVSWEWKNGSNSSYNCTPFLHSLLTKGKQSGPGGLRADSHRRCGDSVGPLLAGFGVRGRPALRLRIPKPPK